jgi:hypothetical protein
MGMSEAKIILNQSMSFTFKITLIKCEENVEIDECFYVELTIDITDCQLSISLKYKTREEMKEFHGKFCRLVIIIIV